MLSVLKNIFKHKERGEPSKLSKDNLQIYHISPMPSHSETSFILDPPSRLPYNFKSDDLPYGDGQPIMLDQRLERK